MKDLVSIIVPVYNASKYINRCLESLVKQTYKNLEIVLVNDGSTDNSLKICQKWSTKDNRIIVIDKFNGGVSSARNIGLDKCNGDYICFVDIDDYVSDNMIYNMYTNINTEQADISEIDFILTDEKNYKKKKKTFFYEIFENEESIKEMFSGNKVENIVCSKMFSRKIIGNIRFNENIKIGEDLLFNYEIMCQKHRIVVDTRDAMYYYVMTENSRMNKKFSDTSFDFIKIFEKINKSIMAELKPYCEAKYIREMMKCVKKMEENKLIGEYLEKKKTFIKIIRNYPISKSLKYLSNKHIITLYLMKLSPKMYVKIYNRYQKQ